MTAVLAWLFDRLASFIPFLHERSKTRVATKARLRHLRGRLVLYAIQGSMYAGEFDEALIEWARTQLSDPEGLPEDPSYREVAGSLDMFLKHPRGFALSLKLSAPGEQRETKFFPAVDNPSFNDLHLSQKDVGLLAALETKIEAINSARSKIQDAHDRTWDSSLSADQNEAAADSIVSAYRAISRQSQDAATHISLMDLMRASKSKAL